MSAARRFLLLLAPLLAAGCGTGTTPCPGPTAGGHAMPDMPDMPAHTARPDKPAAESPAKANTVVIDNFTFAPAELTVPIGAEVTWVNRDDVPHTATSTVKPRAFDSGALDTDQTYSHVFTTPGEYEYFCAVHPHMTGRVIVK